MFSDTCAIRCAPIMADLMQARGPHRASLFLELPALIAEDGQARMLASDTYLPDPSAFMTAGVNKALRFINENLTEDFGETDLATTAGMTAPAFSRSFRKHGCRSTDRPPMGRPG